MYDGVDRETSQQEAEGSQQQGGPGTHQTCLFFILANLTAPEPCMDVCLSTSWHDMFG
jgi:hypothetical protein